MSLLHALFYVRSGGNLDILLGTEEKHDLAQATRIQGGMQPVAEKLAASLGTGVVGSRARSVASRTARTA